MVPLLAVLKGMMLLLHMDWFKLFLPPCYRVGGWPDLGQGFCRTLGINISGFEVGKGDNPISRAGFSVSSKLQVTVTNGVYVTPLTVTSVHPQPSLEQLDTHHLLLFQSQIPYQVFMTATERELSLLSLTPPSALSYSIPCHIHTWSQNEGCGGFLFHPT